MSALVTATRFRRILGYLSLLARNATLPRALNLLQNELEYSKGATSLKSFPPQVTIDITNRCQLRCPLCATGRKELGRPLSVMPLNDFSKIIDEISARSFQVFLYSWGEPLLVKDIHRYIRTAKEANLAVTLSSNLSLPLSDDFLESFVMSGADRFIVSMEGLDGPTYEKYRVGGKFELVVENVRRIAHTRARLGKAAPKLVWQFLAFNHNEHQIETARSLHKEWGFDEFDVEKPNLPFGSSDEVLARKWFASDPSLRLQGPYDVKDNVGSKCFWPWRSAVINPDGGLSPCCYVSDQRHDAGNVIAQGFAAAWNSPGMQKLRNAVLKKDKCAPCSDCSVVI